VGSLDRPHRPEEAVVLEALGPRRPAEPRGVDEPHRRVLPIDHRIHAVPGGPRLLVHHRALLADQAVEDRRLADVRPAHDGEGGALVERRRRILFLRRQQADQPIEQLPGPPAVQGGDHHRIPQPQPIQLGDEVLLGGGVDLVGHQHHRDLGTAESAGEHGVLLLHADRGIDDQDHHLRLLHGTVGLSDDERVHAVGVLHVAAGVDGHHVPASPRDAALQAIPSDARLLVGDGVPLSQEAVQQRRLPDVLPPHDGDPRR
jgi:hypothetical protein